MDRKHFTTTRKSIRNFEKSPPKFKATNGGFTVGVSARGVSNLRGSGLQKTNYVNLYPKSFQ